MTWNSGTAGHGAALTAGSVQSCGLLVRGALRAAECQLPSVSGWVVGGVQCCREYARINSDGEADPVVEPDVGDAAAWWSRCPGHRPSDLALIGRRVWSSVRGSRLP